MYHMVKKTKSLDEVTIRFAGDSGDGMQLTGTQFTNTSAIMGNDLSTLPDYPAEIRAPQGPFSASAVFRFISEAPRSTRRVTSAMCW